MDFEKVNMFGIPYGIFRVCFLNKIERTENGKTNYEGLSQNIKIVGGLCDFIIGNVRE